MLLQRPIRGPQSLSLELGEGTFNVFYKPGSGVEGTSTAPTSRMLAREIAERAQIPDGAHVASVLVKVAQDGSAVEHWVLFPKFVSPLREIGDALVIKRVRPIDAAPTLSVHEPVAMDPSDFLTAMRKHVPDATYLEVQVKRPVSISGA